MVRVVSNFVFILIFGVLSLFVFQAFALDFVRVRGGQHDSYSRLVFDWGRNVSYELKSGGKDMYYLHFDVPAGLDLKALDVSGLSRVSQVKEISQNPLVVEVLSKGLVKVNAFSLGNRIVLDLKETSIKTQVEKAAKKIAEVPHKPPVRYVKKKAADKIERISTVLDKNVLAQPPSQDYFQGKSGKGASQKSDSFALGGQGETPKVIANLEERFEVPKPKLERDIFVPEVMPAQIKPTGRQPNFMTLSSVTPTGLSAFIVGDRLWLVSDQESAVLSPQLVGKQSRDFGSVRMVKSDSGQGFIYNALRGAEYIAQGGGLAWRVLVGTDLYQEKHASQAQRQAVSPHAARSGQVFWSLPSARELVEITDPDTGQLYYVVTVGDAHDFSGQALDFVDFSLLQSPVGMSIAPKVDDLRVDLVEGGVLVYRSAGADVAVSAQADVDAAMAAHRMDEKLSEGDKDGAAHGGKKGERVNKKVRRSLLDFTQWQLGGAQGASENKALVLATLPGLTRDGQLEGLMNMARMYIANGMGAEANGFLEIVETALPALKSNPEFQALRGVSQALNGHYAQAFRLLSQDLIKNRGEVRYWRSYSLAKLADWQQAGHLLPADFKPLHEYPSEVLIPLAITLAEVTLRAGDMPRTHELFALLENPKHYNVMRAPYRAAFYYLKGEEARQAGQVDEAISIWTELAQGDDDLYRVRAGLAVTRLEREEKNFPLSKAVDRLERLRYAWRGDDLEAQVNYWLGRIYFEYGEYVKGLNIMRDSVSYVSSPYLGDRIVTDMKAAFSDLFLGQKLYELSGPDVAALYEHFSELIPADGVGDKVGQRLADRLVEAHLYDRAIEILRYQFDNRLEGQDAYRVGMRIAAIYQLTDQPDKSLAVMDEALSYAGSTGDLLADPTKHEEITLLRAHGYAQSDRVKEALELLGQEQATREMNRLRADIAMEHGYWDDAAEALSFIMEDKGILPERRLDDEGADIILKRAVALNLGGDRIRLANMREVYYEAMLETPRARAFDVVTRLHQTAELADRETLLDVAAEVDVFSDFLDGYKSSE